MIKAFLIATLYFLVIDMTAINLFIVKIYKSNLPSFIEVGAFKPISAILFYLIFLGGLLYFAILPNKSYNISDALLNGALYGL